MDEARLKELLEAVRRGDENVEDAVETIRRLPFEDLGFTKIDTHRHLRQGFPEVILAERKTAEQVIAILGAVKRNGNNVLVTRIDEDKAAAVCAAHAEAHHYPAASALALILRAVEERGKGRILVVTAGTSDIPVAEEAAVTAELMGSEVDRLFDVGVAGIHRLLHHSDLLFSANVVIVAAGMEGALPSVVGGLVARPVIAVPTSVGYGASFGGISALLGMLNSCASGVSVVNIDNGFGAGYVASLINRA